MKATNLIRNIHLLQRAGFGPSAEDIPNLSEAKAEQLFQQLLKKSSGNPAFIKVTTNAFDGLVKGIMAEGKMQELTKEQRAELRKKSREALKDLNLRWLDEMVHFSGTAISRAGRSISSTNNSCWMSSAPMHSAVLAICFVRFQSRLPCLPFSTTSRIVNVSLTKISLAK